ncbi:Hsp20/alpha crystallin family protein [Tahibacter harae]|uniref:Hsp20/alpha crystallin family protein n=1 Tax=Tahibacter harae TaxID=2963937 RepID=A0ABT1QLU7_9GAMM|nr:Hsp20/alpha crystallin family protein [Tahibacter harae]MCQ4163498.1 Hsp20/alpha crystallin family protein [Tahibacter harae]
MNALSRWSPFKNLARIDPSSSFEDLFRGLGGRLLPRDFDAASIPVDVTEKEKSYVVKAQLPGVDKKDIDISVQGNQVSISAEFKREEKHEGEQEICVESYYGKAYRAFTLPDELEGTKAEAHYANGVLTLTVPKKRNGDARRIAVT